MAAHTGVDGVVKVGSNAIAQLTSWSLSASAETIDATLLTSTSKVTLAGTKSYTGSVEMFWDEADAAQISILEGVELTFLLLPEGATGGDVSWSVSGIVDSLDFGAAVDGMVTASATFASNGAITRSTV